MRTWTVMMAVSTISMTASGAPAPDPLPEPDQIYAKYVEARGGEGIRADVVAIDFGYEVDGSGPVDARGIFWGRNIVLSAASKAGQPIEAFASIGNWCRHRAVQDALYEPCENARMLPALVDEWKFFVFDPTRGDSRCALYGQAGRETEAGVDYVTTTCEYRAGDAHVVYLFRYDTRTWLVDTVVRFTEEGERKTRDQVRFSDYRTVAGVKVPFALRFFRGADGAPAGSMHVRSIVPDPDVDSEHLHAPRLIDVAATPLSSYVRKPLAPETLDTDTIVARNTAALGGQAAFDRVKAREVTMRVSISGAQYAVRQLLTQAGETLLEVSAEDGRARRTFVDATHCWDIEGKQKHGTPCGEEIARSMRDDAFLDTAFALESLRPHCDADFHLTNETDGRGMRTIMCRVGESMQLALEVNPRTWLVESAIVSTLSSPIPPSVIDVTFEDYREVEGRLWPHAQQKTERRGKRDGMFTTIRQMKINPQIDRKRFKMP